MTQGRAAKVAPVGVGLEAKHDAAKLIVGANGAADKPTANGEIAGCWK